MWALSKAEQDLPERTLCDNVEMDYVNKDDSEYQNRINKSKGRWDKYK